MHEHINPMTGELVPGPFLRTAHNYDMNKASDETGISCPEPTKAQQQFKDECDINTIVERFGLTGELPTDLAVPQYGDFDQVNDYQTALNIVLASQAAFMQMPAAVRDRFGNDPQRFLEFVHDDKNREEAKKLGLLVPDPQEPPIVNVRVVPEVTPPTK